MPTQTIVDFITDVCAKRFIPNGFVLRPGRGTKHISAARGEICHLCKEDGWTETEIAMVLGIGHDSVNRAARRHRERTT